ncbi:hypothetical protein OA90_27245 [Labrenzia sp. OB1]|nr:hypothetical protein OA90_27245 [Labrenzia sp. OB1]
MHATNNARNSDNLKPVADLPIDDFEAALLPLLRHFTLALSGDSSRGWKTAYGLAAERWGAPIGLSVAHEIGKLVTALEETRGSLPCVQDPLSMDARLLVTLDEKHFLLMVHHMRRDATADARDAVWALTEGHTLAAFIRQALGFAARHSLAAPLVSGRAPVLRIV